MQLEEYSGSAVGEQRQQQEMRLTNAVKVDHVRIHLLEQVA
jgi:hypothetical protein